MADAYPNFPTMTLQSTAVRPRPAGFFVDGDLTIRGLTRPVTLDMEVGGFAPDNFGGMRAASSACTEIDRLDFGVSYNALVPGTSRMLLADKVDITLEVESTLRVQ